MSEHRPHERNEEGQAPGVNPAASPRTEPAPKTAAEEPAHLHAGLDRTTAPPTPPASDPPDSVTDPATQSLSDALRVSFGLLKVLMLILLVAYVFSGVFSVDAQHQAMRLRFGEVVKGEDGRPLVYSQGWHFGLPVPFEEIIRVPITQQPVPINQAFWYNVSDADAGKSREQLAAIDRPLNPLQDGFLLTGDANIVHVKYNVFYVVADPVAYVTHVGTTDRAEELVRLTAERAIVQAVASLPADEVIGGRAGQARAQALTQTMLDELNTGLEIASFLAEDPVMPLSVLQAYQAVTNAESERGTALANAQTDASRTLGAAAGAAAEPLITLIEEYEAAVARDDDEAAERLDAEIAATFEDLRLPDDRGGLPIGGDVAARINDARTYRTQIVQSLRSEAETFRQLLPQFRENPELLTSRLWADVREEVLSQPLVERMYMTTRDFQIVTGGNPEIARQREEAAMRERQEAARNQAATSP